MSFNTEQAMKHHITTVILFAASCYCHLAICAPIESDTTSAYQRTLPEVRVTGNNSNIWGLNTSQMSAHYMPAYTINHIPTLMGEVDVLKALQKLPGVQNSNDGQSGIMVRGGRYDQNMITLDRAIIYHAEHLKGFTSAINASMIRDVCFYKGAFPARFGGQLSSVVDVNIDDGNPTQYHGQVSIGTLSSNFQVTGPIKKGKTWFNAAGRLSYFNLIMRPILESVSDNAGFVAPYANLNYYDATVKLSHLANSANCFSALFYIGHDVDNTKPNKSTYNSKTNDPTASANDNNLPKESEYTLASSTESNWGNIMASLKWQHIYSNSLEGTICAGYSTFNSKLRQNQEEEEITYTKVPNFGAESQRETEFLQQFESSILYHSAIQNIYLAADYVLNPLHNHNFSWGLKAEMVHYNPQIDVHRQRYRGYWNPDHTKFIENDEIIDKILGNSDNVKQISAYADYSPSLGSLLKTNIGVRYMLYNATGKTYHSIEPRVSARLMMGSMMALKASYSRMSQANHLLSSSNLVMPSDLWVPITSSIPITKSDQIALGYELQLPYGIYLTAEGYYKTFDNLLEYAESASYASFYTNWDQMVVLGKGKSYGAELMLEKKEGKTTGWISYTWSKSLNTFDRHNMELNGGKEFYANNDRRHNFNLMLMHSFSKNLDISLGWTYQTGRRGNISTAIFYAGNLDEYQDISHFFSSNYGGGYGEGNNSSWGEVNNSSPWSDHPSFFEQFHLISNYKERNSFVLPAIHRLDLGINYHIFHHLKKTPVESKVSLSIYNIYNWKNVSSVSYGYQDNRLVLKGLCLLPFMPSIQYSLIF